jgi:hypothetical protein
MCWLEDKIANYKARTNIQIQNKYEKEKHKIYYNNNNKNNKSNNKINGGLAQQPLSYNQIAYAH